MEWVRVPTPFETESKALKAAGIVATTEARLASEPRGPQYDVETRVEERDGRWYIFWRKIFIGNKSGCGSGCGSCPEKPPARQKAKAKVIPFRKKT